MKLFNSTLSMGKAIYSYNYNTSSPIIVYFIKPINNSQQYTFNISRVSLARNKNSSKENKYNKDKQYFF